ncbi:hypothetical protein DFQ09_106207 [Winogradskyella pacifica]|uniref:DUF4890 domain-containing protein n=1 Tax=Winogradskyella pacifica TaxID=664642 RepID=A0A3D9LPX0_9FLAO|nr:hypothetical protein [Winogradskyella pacifica]REE08740.1 hypothetical protein DFQ09_106207 [Winogradskyella pacifica]
MKRTILLLVFTIALTSSLFAQKNTDKKVNAYIETVESKITLTDEEKATLITLKTAHANAVSEINGKYEKGSEELKAKRKENNKEFSKGLNSAFGKERAKEIKAASKKNKAKKKKKRN